MLFKSFAGFAGRFATSRSGLSCAMGALIASSALPASMCVTFSTAQAQAQTATPLPAIPVQTQKPRHKKPKTRQPVDQASRSTGAPETNAAAEREKGLSAPLSSSEVKGEAIEARRAETSDTSALLSNTPGVSVYSNGGLAGLPSVHGMEDDRVKVLVDGMTISSACSNHMNPPLSYMSPTQVKAVEVMAGITPVSSGGDSIGGTIVLETLPPEFAAPGEGVAVHGGVSSFVRSNNMAVGGSAFASIATSNVSASYTGSWTRAQSYTDGNGDKVLGTLYEARTQAASFAARKGGDLVVVDLGHQYIPYQGFPNAAMDMVNNEGWYANARYEGRFDWGKLFLKGYYHGVAHEMNTVQERGGDMPMRTEGADFGYRLKAEIPVSERDLLRVGNEFHGQTLDDWWPKDMIGMPMPQDAIILNGATRNRIGTFAEWEHTWSRSWTTLLGARNDVVWMDTGEGQGYMPNTKSADAFNALDRARTDVNFDFTALTRYQPNDTSAYEIGYARKSRAPSLYERYSWYGPTNMFGWFGDGNDYVGNPNLKSEIANTISFTAGWQGHGKHDWDLKVTPYYTYVQDYIDASPLTAAPYPFLSKFTGLAFLTFENHDAELYGVDVSGHYALWNSPDYGRFALKGIVGFVHGENLDTGNSLYHMTPLNAKLALEHKLGNWTNVAELQLGDAKTDVQEARNELRTPGYALVNLRTSYQWEHIRLDLGVSNLFDQQYYSPNGGMNVIQWEQSGLFPPNLRPHNPLAGEGRTFYAGVSMKF